MPFPVLHEAAAGFVEKSLGSLAFRNASCLGIPIDGKAIATTSCSSMKTPECMACHVYASPLKLLSVLSRALAACSLFYSPYYLFAGDPAEKIPLDPGGWSSRDAAIELKQMDVREEDFSPYNMDFKGAGEVVVDQPLDVWRKSGSDVIFYSIRFSPRFEPRGSAKDNPDSLSKIPTLDAGGAVLGYRLTDSGQDRSAELVVHIDSRRGASAGEWLSTGVHFEVKDDGRVVGNAPIVVRADESMKVWDLYLYGELMLADLPYTKRVENFVVRSISKQGASLKDIAISDTNPLFEDEDSDGIPDEFASRHGGVGRDGVLEETGSTLLVEYMARERWRTERQASSSLNTATP